jgi:GT2 family glycosyltransferase
MSRYAPARSALADYPQGPIPQQPTVTVVIPVYNEVEHIEAVAAAILAQEYPQLTAIYFVDGGSTDGTVTHLEPLQQDDRIVILHNPRRSQAAAINLAFAQATTDIIMRLDAHAHYEPGVVGCSVAALLATGAGGVGAIARPLPATNLVGQSIVAAHTSRLGVGVASFRQEASGGWVDTVWNGCYWKHVVDRVGPLREDLPRGEDNDFHTRLRSLGYGLYLEPAIQAYYTPRRSLGELWRQYESTGAGIATLLRRNPRAVGWRHLAPLGLVSLLLLLTPLLSWWRPARRLAMTFLMFYSGALLIATLVEGRKQRGRHLLLLPMTLAALHISYGLGTLRGLLFTR